MTREKGAPDQGGHDQGKRRDIHAKNIRGHQRGAGRESQMSLARWCHQMGGRTRDALPISYLLLVARGAAVARRRAPPFFFLFPLLSPVEGSVIKFTALTVVQASLAEELAGTTGREVPTHSPPSSLQAPRLSMIGREGGRTRDRNARE